MDQNIQTDYEKLRKKFNLPEFNEIDSEFDLSGIEEYCDLLKTIGEIIRDKIAKAGEIIGEIMQPETSISALYESRVFNEKEKNRVFEIYRRIMILKRQADKLFIINDEKMDADFINSSLSEWKQIKPQIVDILTELEDSWKKELERSDKLPYFG